MVHPKERAGIRSLRSIPKTEKTCLEPGKRPKKKEPWSIFISPMTLGEKTPPLSVVDGEGFHGFILVSLLHPPQKSGQLSISSQNRGGFVLVSLLPTPKNIFFDKSSPLSQAPWAVSCALARAKGTETGSEGWEKRRGAPVTAGPEIIHSGHCGIPSGKMWKWLC